MPSSVLRLDKLLTGGAGAEVCRARTLALECLISRSKVESAGMIRTGTVLLCVVATLGVDAALAQSYPSRAIRWVAPSAAGSTSDVATRMVAERLGTAMGTTVLVDNRTGAAGNIAADIVAKSPPDGHTLLTGIVPHAVNPSLYPDLTYDLLKDLAPVTLISSAPLVLVVHPSLPVRTVKDVIALARHRPGDLSYPSAGSGTSSHLAVELFKTMAGINVLHVPYKSIPQGVLELAGGRTSLMINPHPLLRPFITSGKLRAIAVTGMKRSRDMPELPTMDESGLPGYTVTAWQGVLARAGTPREIVGRLNAEIAKVLRAPDMRSRMDEFGFDVAESTPEQFGQFLRTEIDKWAKVVKASGAKVE